MADDADGSTPAAADAEDAPTGADDTDAEDAYRGLFGAFRYAPGASDSLLFRTYAVVAALVGVAVCIIVGGGLIQLVAATAAERGGTGTLVRSFYLVVLLLVLAPLVAPVLFVARRHRRRTRVGERYDALMGLCGYLFLFSLYVGLVITVPPALQSTPTGPLAPVVAFLYALPQLAGLVPPVLAALLILLAHRRLGAKPSTGTGA